MLKRLVLSAVMIPASVLASEPATDATSPRPEPRCIDSRVRPAERLTPQGAMRLGDLPGADMHLLVMRRVDGCEVPTIVVKDVETRLRSR